MQSVLNAGIVSLMINLVRGLSVRTFYERCLSCGESWGESSELSMERQ